MMKVASITELSSLTDMIMTPRSRKPKFPLWQYLTQRLLEPGFALNPQRFWRLYRNAYLERCWQQEYTSKGGPPY
ncbi:hypothetical protein L3556_04765 [Candidatus Synechococcus calcipolaris G9]|uniref:Transposase n=1 Tax=Candidatus Synechococcus calcipolaris G9 TaxID=1497997 RepID=A0ABT6EWU7_9SYNE|nr:hypothetical protein [Candidatus Synechococcus calcipolaris]MDG2990249.1 hypothetical protein [Candidatus Synechococcus calcipolaris G9]